MTNFEIRRKFKKYFKANKKLMERYFGRTPRDKATKVDGIIENITPEQIIRAFKFEDLKEKYLPYLYGDLLLKITMTLDTDEQKAYVYKTKDFSRDDRIKIFRSIKDLKLKAECFFSKDIFEGPPSTTDYMKSLAAEMLRELGNFSDQEKSLALKQVHKRITEYIDGSFLDFGECRNIICSISDDSLKLATVLDVEGPEHKIPSVEKSAYIAIINSFKTDEAKLKLLPRIIPENGFTQRYPNYLEFKSVVETFSSDEAIIAAIQYANSESLKIDFLETIKDEQKRQKLIAMWKNRKYDDVYYNGTDEEKLAYLPFLLEKQKAELIAKLKSDDKKISLIPTLTSDANKTIVINSISSDELKEKALLLITELKNRVDAVCSLDDNRIKEKYLAELEDEGLKTLIIKSFATDELKFNHLSYVKTQESILKIASELKEDIYILRSLSLIETDEARFDLAKKIKDKGMLEESISHLNDEANKARILKVLPDSFKEKHIEEIVNDLNRAIIIKSFSTDELKDKYMALISNPEVIKDIALSFEKDEYKHKYLDKLSDEKLRTELILSMKSDRLKEQALGNITDKSNAFAIIKDLNSPADKLYLLSQMDDFEQIDNIISHMDDFPDKKIKFPLLIKIYANNLSLNEDHLTQMIERFGYVTLQKLKAKNIIDLINLDDETFKKYLEMFSEEMCTIDVSTILSVSSTMINREFRFTNLETISIFNQLELLISERNIEKIKEILAKITSEIDIMSLLEQNGLDLNSFILNLLSEDPLTATNALNFLHGITDKYIGFKKEEYVKARMASVLEELNIPCHFDKNALIKSLFLDYSKDAIIEKLSLIDRKSKRLSPDNIALLDNEQLLSFCIDFKKRPDLYDFKTFSVEIKKALKTFGEILEILYEQREYQPFEATAFIENAPKVYVPKKVNDEALLNVMVEIDTEQFKKHYSDEEIYNRLLKIIKSYKLLGWGNTFQPLVSKSRSEFDATTPSSLINSFYTIYPKLEEKVKLGILKDITLFTILDKANAYGSSSSKYKVLFGDEDFILLRSNPPSNSAALSFEERISIAVKKLPVMYERKFVSVPPIDETLETETGKKLNVVVGNVSNPMNLTYGERTGACMRIGGAGRTLFDFCLENENGFHIRLSDPNTGGFVSRVSGFRNGNTVFLNQLRDSVSTSYGDADLIEIIKKVAKLLILKSKDSNTPIDNVVISGGYVMLPSGADSISLGVPNIKEGLGEFYSDIYSQAILLASSSDDQKLVPLALAGKSIPKYPVQRDKIHFCDDPQETVKKVDRIEMIDQLLGGVAFQFVSGTYEEQGRLIIKLYYGEDWYLGLDKDGNVIKYIMENAKSKEMAEAEIETVEGTLNISKRMGATI